MGSGHDQFGRALAFMRANLATVSDAVRTIDAGLVASTPSLPAVWAVNQLRVNRALGFEELVDLADHELADFEYRQIAVEEQASGPGLERAFRAAGWKVERDVVMVLTDPGDRAADTSGVIEPEEQEVLDLLRRWFEEDTPPPDEIEQLVAFGRREIRTLGDRLLGIRSSDGWLVAMARLRTDGRMAQVEDVYTAPESRGRGYARALVGHAGALARAAGHDPVFIVADDDDWPKLLYARLGFRNAGHLWQFHRG